MEIEKENTLHPTQTIWYVATDNLQVKQYAKKNYGDKVVFAEGEIIHSDKLDLKKIDSDQHQPHWNYLLYLEHSLLSQSDWLLLSSSTFSDTASAIGSPTTLTFPQCRDLVEKHQHGIT